MPMFAKVLENIYIRILSVFPCMLALTQEHMFNPGTSGTLNTYYSLQALRECTPTCMWHYEQISQQIICSFRTCAVFWHWRDQLKARSRWLAGFASGIYLASAQESIHAKLKGSKMQREAGALYKSRRQKKFCGFRGPQEIAFNMWWTTENGK